MSELRIVTEPRVTLLSFPVFVPPAGYEWHSDVDVPDQRVSTHDHGAVCENPSVITEFAGRLCYMSFGEGSVDGHKTVGGRSTNAVYIDNIKASRHGSVLEHANFTLLLEGVSRSLTHELVRHRHFSYSQLSQRYVDESDVAFVLPPEIEQGSDTYTYWSNACAAALANYRNLLTVLSAHVCDKSPTMRLKRIRQTARSLLPNCTETKIVVTGNVRAWRHFLELRSGPAADREMRRLAIEVFEVLQKATPVLFEDYEVVKLPDGTKALTTSFPGV